MRKKIRRSLFVVIIGILLMPCNTQAQVLKSNNADLYYYYNLIPENVKAYLEANNCTIMIDSSKMLRVSVVGDNARNVTAENVGVAQQVVDENNYVLSSDIYIKAGHEYAVLHEIGHILSNYKGNYNAWAETDAWVYIYEQESVNIPMDGYSISTPTEYLAESFSWYILRPEELYMYAPMTWQYINAIVERV